MSQEQAEKAKLQEERAIKQAQISRQQLRSIMSHGAVESALLVASNTTHESVKIQHEETLLAATTGAKKASADMVTKLVKLAAIAASKAAKVEAYKKQVSHKKQHQRVTAAAKAAVSSVIKPIMTMITEVAQEATDHAIQRYPSSEALLSSFALSPEAQEDVRSVASPAADAEAMRLAHKENKEALLNDVEKATSLATEPKVLHFVKELAAKAATHSRSNSLAHNMTKDAAINTARTAAAEVASEALNMGKQIIRHESEKAVERAIIHHDTVGDGKTSKEKVAKDVKNALDRGGHATESAAKQTAKEAIMKNVHRNAAGAADEAKEKGKSQENQAKAGSNAAADGLRKGRQVQKVIDRPEVNVKVVDSDAQLTPDGEPASKVDSNPDKMGEMVLDTIESDMGKQKVSHLQLQLEKSAVKAAESAADAAAKGLKGFIATKEAAREAARLAAKGTVLAEVKDAATLAAQKAKARLMDKGVKDQEEGASAAASQAAKHVLKMAKGIMDKVATQAANKALKEQLKKREEDESDDESDESDDESDESDDSDDGSDGVVDEELDEEEDEPGVPGGPPARASGLSEQQEEAYRNVEESLEEGHYQPDSVLEQDIVLPEQLAGSEDDFVV